MGKAKGLIQPPKVLRMKDTNDVVVIMIYHGMNVLRSREMRKRGAKRARRWARIAAMGAGGANPGGAGPGLWWIHPTFRNRGTAYNSRSFAGNLLFVGDYGS